MGKQISAYRAAPALYQLCRHHTQTDTGMEVRQQLEKIDLFHSETASSVCLVLPDIKVSFSYNPFMTANTEAMIYHVYMIIELGTCLLGLLINDAGQQSH